MKISSVLTGPVTDVVEQRGWRQPAVPCVLTTVKVATA